MEKMVMKEESKLPARKNYRLGGESGLMWEWCDDEE